MVCHISEQRPERTASAKILCIVNLVQEGPVTANQVQRHEYNLFNSLADKNTYYDKHYGVH